MSFSSTIDVTDYINRGVEMLKDNSILRATPVEDSLVSGVLAQEPPIDQSPNVSILPIIFVSYSRSPMRQIDNFGRDSLDAAGAKYYHLEFYNVCIARGISKQAAQQKVQRLSELVRDVYQKNLRMTDPANPGTDPIAATNTVLAIPYILKSTVPNIQAINVICRPDVPIDLT